VSREAIERAAFGAAGGWSRWLLTRLGDLTYHLLMLRAAVRREGVIPGVALPIGAATREVRARVILAGSSAEAYKLSTEEEHLCHAEC